MRSSIARWVENGVADLAAALAEDENALTRLSRFADAEIPVGVHRVVPRLANSSERLKIKGPQVAAWRKLRDLSAGNWLRLERGLYEVGQTLESVGVRWTALKGMDLSTRVYVHPEERPTSDLDVLVSSTDFSKAREALVQAGWRPTSHGQWSEDSLRSRGYAWQAVNARRVMVELHFRLWSGVPEAWAAEVLERGEPEPRWGDCGVRVRPADAFVIGACHLALSVTPRPLVYWFDLHLLAEDSAESFVDEVVELAQRWGLDLLVFLGATVSDELWPQPLNGLIAKKLAPGLRWAERRAVASFFRIGPVDTPRRILSFARWISRRPGRMLRHTAIPDVWFHAWVVERATDANAPWWLRRAESLRLALSWRRFARWAALLRPGRRD